MKPRYVPVIPNLYMDVSTKVFPRTKRIAEIALMRIWSKIGFIGWC